MIHVANHSLSVDALQTSQCSVSALMHHYLNHADMTQPTLFNFEFCCPKTWNVQCWSQNVQLIYFLQLVVQSVQYSYYQESSNVQRICFKKNYYYPACC